MLAIYKLLKSYLPAGDSKADRQEPPAIFINTKSLPAENLSKYNAYLRSNDYVLNIKESLVASEGKLIVIASTSLTALSITCELGEKNQSHLIPELVLIDNGAYAAQLWDALRKFFLENLTLNDALEKITPFIYDNLDLISISSFSSAEQHAFALGNIEYFQKIINQHDYQFLRKVALQTVYLAHDWGIEEIFIELKRYIDKNNFEKIFVYPSNIVALSRENLAMKILENIDSLEPHLSIHTNLNPVKGFPDKFTLLIDEENRPKNAFEVLSDAINLTEELCHHNDLPIQMMLFGGPLSKKKLNAIAHKKIHNELNVIRKQHNLTFNQFLSPFLIDMIFKLAGINVKINTCPYEAASYNFYTVFHLPFPKAETAQYSQILLEKFPSLSPGAPFLKQANKIPGYPSAIAMKSEAIAEIIVPLIPAFLAANPAIASAYAENYLALEKIEELFGFYHMSTTETDCFEETLCYTVNSNLEKENIFDENLKTTDSSHGIDSDDNTFVSIFLTTPITSAQHIVDYFNKIAPDSAKPPVQEFVASKQSTLTKISVSNSALLNATFLQAMWDTIRSYPKDIQYKYYSAEHKVNLQAAASRFSRMRLA
jgi:hypothetical protein